MVHQERGLSKHLIMLEESIWLISIKIFVFGIKIFLKSYQSCTFHENVNVFFAEENLVIANFVGMQLHCLMWMFLE